MSQMRFAVDGNTKSGVVVAQIRRSTSAGAVLVFSRSPFTAAPAMCEVPSPSPLRMWRSLMPVRSMIQESVGVDQRGEFRIGQHIVRQTSRAPP